MDLAQIFIARSRYYLQMEYRTKIRAAVEALPTDALWWRANDQSNSVGNLLMHLAGNIRQWIVAGVGRATDRRNRDGEFAARGGATAAELLGILDQALDDVDAVLAKLTPDDLAGADEAFLSSSVAGVLPVTSFDGRPIGGGVPGPWTLRARADREAMIAAGDAAAAPEGAR